MIDYQNKYSKDTSLLLKDFNDRDPFAFGFVYNKFYDEFHLYASSLYSNTIVDSRDAVQDVFLHIWDNHKLNFKRLINIKAFVIIMLKNRYKNYINHLAYEDKFHEYIKDVDKDFEFDIIENEYYTTVERALAMLPNDSAEILRYYIEGYNPEEISEITGRSLRTVYNKKSEAIAFLKNKISKKDMFILIGILGG